MIKDMCHHINHFIYIIFGLFWVVKYSKPIVILVFGWSFNHKRTLWGNSHRTGSWVQSCAAGGRSWTPHQQVNQYRDEADGDEGEGDHQAVGSVLHMKFFSGAVVEVQRVNLQEKLLCFWVWIKTADGPRYYLQTMGQDVVRSGRKFINDGKKC